MNDSGGVVYLVGAGPGAPGLLTVRGREVLERAEVVVHDHLVSARVLDVIPSSARRLAVGKYPGHATVHQEEINAILVVEARAGRRVVRLKGGDPFVFGRGAEEAEHLFAAGVPFEIVPGVTAGLGASAYAGLAVTHRAAASAVAFVTGHDDPHNLRAPLDWSALAQFPGTLVIYMGVARLRVLCEALIAEGKPADTPAALVQWGSLPQQRTVVATLADLPDRVAEAGLKPPGLIVVGKIVVRRPALNWFERLPLFGQRVVVTRPRDEAERAAADLEARGAEALIAPTVEIRPIPDPEPLDAAIARLAEFDWLVFTSGNGVRSFIERLDALGRDLRALGHVKIAAIGPGTASVLDRFHLRADLVPPSFRSEALAEALAEAVRGRHVLLARADRGRAVLRDELERIASVEQVAVYQNADVETIPEEVVSRISAGSVDWITLTSSAITERLFALLPDEARSRIGHDVKLASLSPVTSETARRLGWPIAIEATTYTWMGLLDALVTFVRSAQLNSR